MNSRFLAVSSCLALFSAAHAQPCKVSLTASDYVLTPGESAQVNTWAHFPAAAYAFASTTMNVAANFQGWSAASAGVIAGANVFNIAASQDHNPFLGIFADPANPLRIWSGVYTPANYNPRLVTIAAIPGPFSYYPNQLTRSTADCNAAPGQVRLLVNPVTVASAAAAPGDGTRIEVVGNELIASSDTSEILIGLLVPAVQVIHFEPGAPLGMSVQIMFNPDDRPTDSFSINFQKIVYDYQPFVDASLSGPYVFKLLRDGQVVGEFVSPDGEAPFTLDRVPNSHTQRLDESDTTRHSTLVSTWMYDGSVRAHLPNDHSLTIDAVEVEMECSNNLRQLGIAIHSYQVYGRSQFSLFLNSSSNPCPADFNNDGGVDGSDVVAFYSDWENGAESADVDANGGIDGADVATFFAHWERGGC